MFQLSKRWQLYKQKILRQALFHFFIKLISKLIDWAVIFLLQPLG
jgi:hypothetical protein